MESDICLYDTRRDFSKDGFSTALGKIVKLFITKDGRLTINTHLAYELVIALTEKDMRKLRIRLNQIEKERSARKKARELKKANQQE